MIPTDSNEGDIMLVFDSIIHRKFKKMIKVYYYVYKDLKVNDVL